MSERKPDGPEPEGDPARASMDAAEDAVRGLRGGKSMGPWTWAILLILVVVIVTSLLS